MHTHMHTAGPPTSGGACTACMQHACTCGTYAPPPSARLPLDLYPLSTAHASPCLGRLSRSRPPSRARSPSMHSAPSATSPSWAPGDIYLPIYLPIYLRASPYISPYISPKRDFSFMGAGCDLWRCRGRCRERYRERYRERHRKVLHGRRVRATRHRLQPHAREAAPPRVRCCNLAAT